MDGWDSKLMLCVFSRDKEGSDFSIAEMYKFKGKSSCPTFFSLLPSLPLMNDKAVFCVFFYSGQQQPNKILGAKGSLDSFCW